MPLFRKTKTLLTKTNSLSSSNHGSPKNGQNGLPKSYVQTEVDPVVKGISPAELSYDPNLRMRTKSRLSKTLQEVLEDHSSLAYFIQYLEAEGVKQLVKFWLEVQSFHCSLLVRSDQTSESPVPNRTKCKSNKSVSFQLGEGDDHVLGEEERVTAAEEGMQTEEQLCFSLLLKCGEQDALNIYKKYLSEKSPSPLGVDENIKKEVLGNLLKCNDKLDANCFSPAQVFVYKKMETNYFPAFLRSSFHCKHQVDLLTSDQVFLADILYNDSTLFYFMEFMEQEGVRHLVDFLLMADNFRNHLLEQMENGYDSEQAQSDAMVIYDKYFSLQATSSLGLSDRVRFELELNICQENGLQPSCFLKPVMILLQYIEKTHLPPFLKSQLYFKYLSECIVTIQTTGLLQGHRKRSGSDSSSSEVSSLSQTNTLLAMDNKGSSRRQIKHLEEQDMRIDTGQFEPDTLWRRNMSGKLQMAHVDKFGKLVSEFEPEPEKKTGSKLSQAMRKFVNWEDDKAQESMAWQVAEMIVKDVCSITLGEKDNVTVKVAH